MPENSPVAITSSSFSASPRTAKAQRPPILLPSVVKKCPCQKNLRQISVFFRTNRWKRKQRSVLESGAARTSLFYRKLLYCLPVATGITATIRRTGRSESERYGGCPCAL